jgi:hypothetical protein
MKERSEDFRGSRFCMQFPCNPFVKYYAKVFYMIYEGHSSSIRRRTSVDWLLSMGEINNLSFGLTESYVAALTSRLHRSEAALQLPCDLSYRDTCY